MLDAIIHRGPDDEGTYVDGSLAMGMRRLSIIDLGSGHQPIRNENGTVWVVFNGEIYNYRQLRAQLQQQGHAFYTQSDTEVIVHLYEQYGEDFVQHLNGMFGIALWDRAAKKLILVRDRVGEKQLFYSHKDGQLTFGSELKCLLRAGVVSSDLNLHALQDFFTFLYGPAPDTIFEDAKELPPATMMVADASGVRQRCYWDVKFAPDRSMGETEWLQEFRTRFRSSVRSRLVSDVPLGALLSGGVDSSAVVAEMAANGGQVKTFCIGYEGDAGYYDERRYAAIVARQYGTQHHELVVKPDLREVLPVLVESFDQPFADSSAIANYYVFRETRRHVKVVLTGLGGDEVAAGYERYLGLSWHGRYQRLPRWLRSGLIGPAIGALPELKSGGRLIERLKRFAAQGDLSHADAYINYVSAFDQDKRVSLFSPAVLAELASRDPGARMRAQFERADIADLVNKALYVDTHNYLTGDLLTLTDRMSMRSSIEARAPFVDHELVEFMARVPPELKLHGKTKKYLLKQAFTGELPHEILHRSKRGFTLPLTLWLRGELNGWMREILSRERIAKIGYFNADYVQRLIAEHSAGRENHHARLWALLMFVSWHEHYLGNTRR